MRRRAIIAAQTQKPDSPAFFMPVHPDSYLGKFAEVHKKGFCDKCHKYIGKGVGPHKRWCKG